MANPILLRPGKSVREIASHNRHVQVEEQLNESFVRAAEDDKAFWASVTPSVHWFFSLRFNKTPPVDWFLSLKFNKLRSMSLKYEPASEPLNRYVKQLLEMYSSVK